MEQATRWRCSRSGARLTVALRRARRPEAPWPTSAATSSPTLRRRQAPRMLSRLIGRSGRGGSASQEPATHDEGEVVRTLWRARPPARPSMMCFGLSNVGQLHFDDAASSGLFLIRGADRGRQDADSSTPCARPARRGALVCVPAAALRSETTRRLTRLRVRTLSFTAPQAAVRVRSTREFLRPKKRGKGMNRRPRPGLGPVSAVVGKDKPPRRRRSRAHRGSWHWGWNKVQQGRPAALRANAVPPRPHRRCGVRSSGAGCSTSRDVEQPLQDLAPRLR